MEATTTTYRIEIQYRKDDGTWPNATTDWEADPDGLDTFLDEFLADETDPGEWRAVLINNDTDAEIAEQFRTIEGPALYDIVVTRNGDRSAPLIAASGSGPLYYTADDIAEICLTAADALAGWDSPGWINLDGATAEWVPVDTSGWDSDDWATFKANRP
jgi:hypothetical protein